MKIISFNGTVRALLETHPEIDKLAQELYAGTTEGNPSTGDSTGE